jgi:putative phosphoesterase
LPLSEIRHPPPAVRRIGLISDTHGLVRPEVHGALAAVEMILHAGDVGGEEVLDELSTIAPVHAVSGNTDPPGDRRLHQALDISVGGFTIHVSHGHELGVPKPEKLLMAYNAQVIVFGHTHEPLVVKADGRLVVNPGAAGPARFDIKPSVAILEIKSGSAEVVIVPIG